MSIMANEDTYNTSVNLTKQNGTKLVLLTERKYLTKNVNIDLSAKKANPTFSGGEIIKHTAAAAVVNGTVNSTGASGVVITPFASAGISGVLYDGAVDGWVSKSNGAVAILDKNKVGWNGSSMYLTDVTLGTNKTFSVRTPTADSSIVGTAIIETSAINERGYTFNIDNNGSLINSPSWTLLEEASINVNTDSVTPYIITTVSCGTAAYDANKIICVRIYDTTGPRTGYFLGSETFFINYYDANNTTTTLTSGARMIHFVKADGSYGQYNEGSYGVYGYSINSIGNVTIYACYNENYSLTIDGTFAIKVYALDYPDFTSIFNRTT